MRATTISSLKGGSCIFTHLLLGLNNGDHYTHRAQIREITQMREFRRADEETLLDWLATSILHHEHHPERLCDLIRAEYQNRGIEAPDDIAALIETGLLAYEAQIYIIIAARLTPDMQERLDALLMVAPIAEGKEVEELPLSLLRLDPGPVGVESALSEISKLRSLRAIGLSADLFAGYAPKIVERLRRRIAAESPSHIRQHPHSPCRSGVSAHARSHRCSGMGTMLHSENNVTFLVRNSMS